MQCQAQQAEVSRLTGCKRVGIEGGGHEHHLEVSPDHQHLTQKHQQQVRVEGALMDLVHDNMADVGQQRIGLEAPE